MVGKKATIVGFGQIAVLVGAVALALIIFPGRAQADPNNVGPGASERCNALGDANFQQVPDAPTKVIDAKSVDPGTGTGASAYCEISGYVAPNIGFLLRLPSGGWNGKLIELGCGGACGTTAHIAGCDDPLRRGYACIVSDGGHKSSGVDVMWAYDNPQAVMDYFVRASHVTALAGKVIAQRYYGQASRRSYFMGCSSGGVQAMWLAQRFPWDFDGIVAGSPPPNLTASLMNLLWDNRALTDQAGNPLLDQGDLEVLHQAVVAKCDLNDGIRDGVIGDPRACRFEPAELRCTADRKGPCLSPRQIEAVKKIYAGPTSSDGAQIVSPTAQMGSERTWLGWFQGSVVNPTPVYNYVGDWFRYYVFQPNPGPGWKREAFDFDHDYKRLGMAEISDWGSSPDLRRFKAAGGKLLTYTGWNDAVVGVLDTLDYYGSVEKILGGPAATQEFFRLFVVPGMNHCGGGEGASIVDWLTYLEAWVEGGRAPDKVIGAHLKTDAAAGPEKFPLDPQKIEFSRPVYPFPLTTKYSGHGDPKDAASFRPAGKYRNSR